MAFLTVHTPWLPLTAFNPRWHSDQRGHWGEGAVARRLWRDGYRVRAHRWKSRDGSDIDLICSNDRHLLFAEVKVRSAADPEDLPWAEVFHPDRKARLLTAIGEYLMETEQVFCSICINAYLVTPYPEHPRRPRIETESGYLQPVHVPGWRGPK